MDVQRRRWLYSGLLACALVLPLLGASAASDTGYGLKTIAEKAYGKQTFGQLGDDPVAIAGAAAGVALSVLGVVFLILIVLAGIKWMMAQGNQDKVTEARNSIVHALIGLVIVVAAYAIVDYALKLAIEVSSKQGG